MPHRVKPPVLILKVAVLLRSSGVSAQPYYFRAHYRSMRNVRDIFLYSVPIDNANAGSCVPAATSVALRLKPVVAVSHLPPFFTKYRSMADTAG